VTFKDSATTLGTGTLDGSGQATFSTSSLSASNHIISAVYGGDFQYNTSTSTNLTQTVNKANTTTGVASSQNPSVFGQSVSFTATVAAVAPGAGTPTGSVIFKDGATALATNILSSGQSTLTTSSLSASNHLISVVPGTNTFNTST
jgi:hypothetical protein